MILLARRSGTEGIPHEALVDKAAASQHIQALKALVETKAPPAATAQPATAGGSGDAGGGGPSGAMSLNAQGAERGTAGAVGLLIEDDSGGEAGGAAMDGEGPSPKDQPEAKDGDVPF